jgi:hypothetical protein
MEYEIEIDTGEGQTFFITYAIETPEKRTMEHPGVDGGIEIISAYDGRGNDVSLSNEILEEMVEQELASYE